MSKPTIIPNWKYQKPTKGGYKGLKKLLKYVSHRESPDHRPLDADVRWTDCGLGDSWKAVYQNAGQSPARMCWRITWSSRLRRT